MLVGWGGMYRAHVRVHAPLLTAAIFSSVLSLTPRAEAEDCTPPRILFVVDASSSMLEGIEQTSKWNAAQVAIDAVLTMHGDVAQYGLMTFPGGPGQCSTGEVLIDVAAGTAPNILSTLGGLNIPGNAQTPAGQTLMAASNYALITDPAYANYVIFVTDGHQWCDVNNGAACVSAQDCTDMGIITCPTCQPSLPDGCYCVQNWPALGAGALYAAGVSTYVVGFGALVNYRGLNQTADAGGTALPNCDPDADVASCYFQADMPSELTAALSTIVQQVVTESCIGPCGIDGERSCTLAGWADCDAPDSVACQASCGLSGTQQCVNDVLTECSSESQCGTGGGSTSSGSGGASSGSGGASSSSGTGGASSSSSGQQSDDADPEDTGSCGCRVPGGSDDSQAWLLALAAGLVVARRRRRD